MHVCAELNVNSTNHKEGESQSVLAIRREPVPSRSSVMGTCLLSTEHAGSSPSLSSCLSDGGPSGTAVCHRTEWRTLYVQSGLQLSRAALPRTLRGLLSFHYCNQRRSEHSLIEIFVQAHDYFLSINLFLKLMFYLSHWLGVLIRE